MRGFLKNFVGRLVATPGHSLPVLIVALVLSGIVNFVPNGLGWALRVSGILLLAVFVKLAVSDLPALVDWLVRSPLARYEKLCRLANRHIIWLRRIESLLAAAVVLPACVHFGQSLHAMSAASLQVDEIGSILNYSSRGPLIAATKYNLAKNHIFFSVVNSLTPGSDSLNPARARFWSFAAVGLSLTILLVFFWRHGSPLAGAVAFALPALNLEYLSKVFEARGYGFVSLAAVVGLVALNSFLRTGRGRDLWIMGISTALGTWTLPFHVVFGGGLMLLLFLIRPWKKVFLAGFATGLAILALYAPVFVQMWRVTADYEESYGRAFESIGSVLDAMRYVIPPAVIRVNGTFFLGALILVVALPLVLRRHRPRDNTSLQMAAILILAFYAFCLVLASPPPRITAFLAMPVAFVAGMLICQGLTFPEIAPLRLFIASGLAVVFFLSGTSAVRTFSFEPDQRWQDAASAVRALFPEGTRVYISGYRNSLGGYLGKTFDVREKIPDEQELREGNRLLFSAAHFPGHHPVDAGALYPTLQLFAVRFPLKGSREQILYVHVPPSFFIGSILIGNKAIGLPTEIPRAATAKIVFSAPARSLHLLFKDPVDGLAVTSSLGLTKSGNLLSIKLPEAAREVEFAFPEKSGAFLEAAWAYPEGF